MVFSNIEWRAEKRRTMPDGVCSNYPYCTRHRDDWRKKCAACREKFNGWRKRARAKQIKEPEHCSVHDCRKVSTDGFRMCSQCRENENTGVKRRNAKLKAEVMLAYGNQCSCCGECESSFMSIDHIDGYDGTGPRKSIPLYRWLKKNSYPEGFRVLCMNCNASRGYYGYCPHQPSIIADEDRYKRDRSKRFAIKRMVFEAYGGCCCSCCDENTFEFLCMDHIYNNGAKHRKDVGSGSAMYAWIKRNNYPDWFQVLCINCNFSKGHSGECAHLASDKGNG